MFLSSLSTARIVDNLAGYWRVRGELTLCNELLLKGICIVVPKSMQTETSNIHQGHKQIVKYCQGVSMAIWWPEIVKEIETQVKSYPVCQKMMPPSQEPLLQQTTESSIRFVRRGDIAAAGKLTLK